MEWNIASIIIVAPAAIMVIIIILGMCTMSSESKPKAVTDGAQLSVNHVIAQVYFDMKTSELLDIIERLSRLDSGGEKRKEVIDHCLMALAIRSTHGMLIDKSETKRT